MNKQCTRRKRQILRMLASFVIVWSMLVSMAMPVSAAVARATTMKLEKTEGTVTLKTQNGSARKITSGMRLYNGNALSTGKYSYAYVSLDNTKAVKLDQSSSVTLRQSGSKLELLVKSGKLFFNVSQPLTEKENMNVRTSTMVTGIRGTCGVVEYIDENKSRLHLLEGKVTLGSGDNATTVYGGQTATVILQPKAQTGDTDKPGDSDKPGETDKIGQVMEQKVEVAALTEKTIPSVALQEIVNDPVLLEKIEQTTELKIEKIEEAFEQFQKEEAERIEQEKEEQDKDSDKDKDKEDKKPEDGNQSDSSGGSSGPSTPGQPSVSETVLSGTVTPEVLKKALQEYSYVHVGKEATMDFGENETLTIPSGKILSVQGTQSIPESTTIYVGEGAKEATLNVAEGAVFTAGTIRVTAGSRLENHATLSGWNLISADGAKILNADLIILSGAYTSTGVAAYSDNEQAALISRSESTAMPSGSLLMTAQDSSSQDQYYYYARSMVKNVIVNMDIGVSAVSGPITWNFAKNAVIPAGDGVGLGGFRASMNNFEMQVKGTLTLYGETKISGLGEATVRLAGGSLVLGKAGDETASAEILNENHGFAVAHDEGTLTWNNKRFRLIAAAGVEKSLTGVKEAENNTIEAPGYVTLVEGVLEWNSYMNELRYVPSEFYNPSEEVGKSTIEYSLGANPVMIIGESVTGMLNENETVTIPAGKTLVIRSKPKALDADRYSGGFNIGKNAGFILEPGATLQVEGMIFGNGTIDAKAGANVKVVSGATLMADSIKLEQANLTVDGTVDGGSITSTGGSAINNNALIKLAGMYGYDTSVSDASGDTYKGGDDSLLLSDKESGAMAAEDTLMFATATDGGTVKQCYYASRMNDYVVKYMNALAENETDEATKWVFKNDVRVPEGKEITLTNFNADAGTYALQVEGNLTLTDIVEITGSGAAVIYLTGDGKLTLGGTGEGMISNVAEETPNYYAIAASEDILKSQETHLCWENEKLSIRAKKAVDYINEYIVQGGCIPEDDPDGRYVLPKWVEYKDGYSVEATAGSGIASLVK